METEDKTKEILENKFMTNFGMTIDQFERLDFETQEQLIKKVAKLRHKMEKKAKNAQFRFGEVFTYYPIFAKTANKRKRKSIFDMFKK